MALKGGQGKEQCSSDNKENSELKRADEQQRYQKKKKEKQLATNEHCTKKGFHSPLLPSIATNTAQGRWGGGGGGAKLIKFKNFSMVGLWAQIARKQGVVLLEWSLIGPYYN